VLLRVFDNLVPRLTTSDCGHYVAPQTGFFWYQFL
jgi:hypothetical protein